MEIKPYPKNAKKHPKDQIRKIADSIEAFGFNQPIVVDKDGVIIVGHGRFEAAKLLGIIDPPLIVVDLPPERVAAYRLADNKLNESDWDMDMVLEELKGLSLEMVELTGFDKSLIQDPELKDDVVPAVGKDARTARGDLYTLGGHRILCGDAISLTDIDLLMGGQEADLVFTDPPYNVDYEGSGKNTERKILNDNLDDDSFYGMLLGAFRMLRIKVKEGAALYVFHDFSSAHLFAKALSTAGFEIVNQLIWNKPTAGLGMGDFRKKHEPFYYAKVEGQTTTFYGDRTHTSVLNFQDNDEKLLEWAKRQRRAELEGKTTIWSMKRENVNDYLHPTQKPVELVEYALKNNTKAGDIVLDTFAGSGSTLIGAEKLGRRAFLMELDPHYVDTMVQRYVDWTGGCEVLKNGVPEEWEPTIDQFAE